MWIEIKSNAVDKSSEWLLRKIVSQCDTGEVKIADFGVAARLRQDDAANESPTQQQGADRKATPRVGTVIGSPLWMAPEMIADGICDTPV